jgi:UDP-glucose 4-epimerase
MSTRILVTGGAGFIGSHTCVALLDKGYDVTVIDNLSNSEKSALVAVEQISGRSFTFHEGDVRDHGFLKRVFSESKVDAVIHFAGLKAVGESVEKPLEYFENNVVGSIALFKAMEQAGVVRLVFSSSATVYGNPSKVPILETALLRVTNPYGRTKLMVEDILNDLMSADAGCQAAILRYFNPAGAHSSGLLGESPRGTPNNLLPYIAQVAAGLRPKVSVFGNDYSTPDGTGVRDYIHVVDLAAGHIKALQRLFEYEGGFTVNLGTGRGYSVLEVIAAFEKASGRTIAYDIVDRRPGDIAACYADPGRAMKLFRWKADKTLAEMCLDHWRWQSRLAK